ncbi:MAG: Hsp70 family protein [Myxococcales bacterium]|nr:Hsp70 family protein [Myxococcales bacterium]
MTDALYVGIDLGTTNSAAAVFDGDRVESVRNSQGTALTPSLVRVDGSGRVTIGHRARRFLALDPTSVRGEFKRLMGTREQLDFPAAGLHRRPEELAAELLRSLRHDIETQIGVAPRCAVISVPALFELPQVAATREAATLAGFEVVELIQEPVASALASGWRADDSSGHWMVYDLGGGTFDVSLLETQGGFLNVVAHGGDNFLGGRDLDWAIVDWVLARMEAEHGVTLSREEPGDAPAIRRLKSAVEDVKIELSAAADASLLLPGFLPSGHLELTVTRADLERLCAPLIDRTVEICQRLLAEHRLRPADIERLVLVGGPTAMPLLRERVAARLGVPLQRELDPMTAVAHGAALYAASAGLDARPRAANDARGPAAKLWLRHPAVSADLKPHVVGKVTGAAQQGKGVPETIRLRRKDGRWESAWTDLNHEAGFIIGVELEPRRPNVFEVLARDPDGAPVPVQPDQLTIVQGMSLSDPPLSRRIGVALASDKVQVYFDRGEPLPARRTFRHHTVETVAAGSDDCLLKIPIVQGEFERAHLCRLVGTLEIRGRELKGTVPAGAPVELTLELDRGGNLSARALLPDIDQVFEEIAHLLVPEASHASLTASFSATERRLQAMRTRAFRGRLGEVIEQLDALVDTYKAVERDIAAAAGGDADAGLKARRTLLELDAQLERLEGQVEWPELKEEARWKLAWSSHWLEKYGNDHENRLFEEAAAGADRAEREQDAVELERQISMAYDLGFNAFLRDPEAWPALFENAAAEADRAHDLPRAHALVDEGRAAVRAGDRRKLERVVRKLWTLLPAEARQRQRAFQSGLR